MGPMEIGMFRFAVQGVICCGVMIKGKIPVWPPGTRVRVLLLARSFVGTCGMLCYFYALANMSLSDATIIVFTNPIITTILGAVVRTRASVGLNCVS